MNSRQKNSSSDVLDVDVLCAGFACHDLVFDVDHHPAPDEKVRASALVNCGGGLASNAAVTAARLGCRTAFVGYLGADVYGDLHVAELHADGINTDWVIRGSEPTPLSALIIKPSGARAIVGYRGHSEGLCTGRFDLTKLQTKSILIDGNQFGLAQELLDYAKANLVPTVIDADVLSPQTAQLVQRVEYVVASERFAKEYSGEENVIVGLAKLATVAPNVVVTLGEQGLIWQRGDVAGRLAAFSIVAVDTTGAGDAFHGAFAAGLAKQLAWDELLCYASAVGALCCTKMGGRVGVPTARELGQFLASNPALLHSSL